MGSNQAQGATAVLPASPSPSDPAAAGSAVAAVPNVGGAPRPAVGLSIVIPAYNEERRLPRTLAAITEWVDQQDIEAEILVVENGSADATVELAQQAAEQHPYIQVMHGLPRGKGIAVRAGMLQARGELRFLCDADLSMPIGDIDKFIPVLRDGRADVAIGSREAPGARRFDEPAYRHAMGRVFNWIVKILAVPGVEDTQCGFKMFRGSVADDVFQSATLKGWGFDPEILFIARKRGYAIEEIPIDWHYDPDSRVQALRDPLTMIRDLIQIRVNNWRGRYDRRNDNSASAH